MLFQAELKDMKGSLLCCKHVCSMHVMLCQRLRQDVNSYGCCAPAVNQTADKPYYLFDGYAHLAAGLACGLAGLAAGMAIGIVGDAGVRCVANPQAFSASPDCT